MKSATADYRQDPACAAPDTDCARILLVEDNQGDAELVRAILEHNDMIRVEVVHCARLDEAVTKLHDEEWQLVMLDLGLPDSQGLETLSRIQLAAKLVPVVVFTGQEDLELSKRAIRLGAQECLCKSHISGAMLMRTIGNAVVRQQILAATTARSLTDELTGLYNRRGLLACSASLIKAACRLRTPMILLYGDLDGLKSINDTLGHAAGDHSIREAAAALRATFRDSDVLSRLGGDEFAVLAVGTSGDNCDLLCERVQAAFQQFNEQPNRKYRLSISLGGVELDPTQPVPLESLLREADCRMYAQKRANQRQNVVLNSSLLT